MRLQKKKHRFSVNHPIWAHKTSKIMSDDIFIFLYFQNVRQRVVNVSRESCMQSSLVLRRDTQLQLAAERVDRPKRTAKNGCFRENMQHPLQARSRQCSAKRKTTYNLRKEETDHPGNGTCVFRRTNSRPHTNKTWAIFSLFCNQFIFLNGKRNQQAQIVLHQDERLSNPNEHHTLKAKAVVVLSDADPIAR